MNAATITAKTLIQQRTEDHGSCKVLMCLLSFGITESQLARQLGFSVSLITQWRQGLRPISEQRLGELYELLGEFISARAETIRLLKEQNAWDSEARRILRRNFNAAEKIYRQRPQQYRKDAA